jgi:glycosyltransferase involved in cell wall biosynthesis
MTMRIALFKQRLLALGGGERMMLNIAQALASAGHAVDFLYGDTMAYDYSNIESRLNISLEGIRLRGIATQTLSAASHDYDLLIYNAHGQFAQPNAKRSVLLCFFPVGVDLSTGGRWRWHVGNVLRPVKHLLSASLAARLEGLPSRDQISALRAYDNIWAITQYTQKWVRHYWARDSRLLYPLVKPIKALPKENSIVSVGRFLVGHSNKKHEVLVRAFREMVDAGLRGWQLHIVGGLTDEPEHARYFAELQASAQHYPIHLHPNLPHAQLSELVGKAKIYWHATGFGEDLTRFPDRAEHFGISTVEAMSAGCVPVVINAGGQPEIVTSEQCGYLWRTVDELKAQTLQLIHQPEQWAACAAQAQQRSKTFCDAAAFNQRVQQFVL